MEAVKILYVTLKPRSETAVRLPTNSPELPAGIITK
jgi:hypothetical protein